MRILAMSLTVIASLTVLAGCAHDAPSRGAVPTNRPIDAPFSATLALSAEQTRLLHDATEQSIAKCMRERGYSYKPLPYLPPDEGNSHIGDLGFAQQHGYGLRYTRGQDIEGASAQNAGPAGLSTADRDAYSKALLGEPILPDSKGSTIITIERTEGSTRVRSDSCISLGTSAIRGDVREWYTTSAQVEDMVNDVRRRVQTDPAFAVADRRWKDCMAAAGLGRESRAQHMEMLMSEFATGHRSAEDSLKLEKSIAVADATCVDSSGAGSTLRDLFARYEKQVGDSSQAVLARFAELNKASLERAARRP